MTAASLHILMSKAYNEYQAKSRENEQENPLSKDEWKDAMAKKSPQFQYWSSVLNLELICLRLVRAFRERNFPLCIDAVRQILPWMFVMDHSNYARWLAVHCRDMCVLPSTNPRVYKYFSDGSFVVHKTPRLFLSIALDHCHEQVNAVVKGEGGAVGLTENPAALRRWMVASPELSRMVQEFEGSNSLTEENVHHEQKPGVQSAFFKDVLNTVSSFEELANPSLEEGENLMAIHTKGIMDDTVVRAIRDAGKIGEEQFNLSFKE